MRLDVRSLRNHPNFRLFFIGQFVSLIGSWMQGVALGWLVYRLTGSELTLGLVAFSQNLPVLVLGPAAGWVADRFSRRHTVIATHVLSMLQASALAYLTLTDRITVPHILVLAAVFGISNAFEMPARQSMVGDLVGREDLPNAIALNSSMINVTRILGPAVAGVIVAALGEGECFLVNAITFFAAIATLLVVAVPKRAFPPSLASPFRQMADGLAYVRARRPISGLLALLAVCSVMAMPYMVLLPVFAKELGAQLFFGEALGGPRTLGILQAAGGVGALIGALTLSNKKGVQGFGRIVAGSAMIAGASLIAFSGSPWLVTSILLIFPIGFGLMRFMAATNTLLQSMVADEFRGRVMSFYSMMLVGMAPFGALIAGLSAEAIGARWTVLGFGAAGLAASAYARVRLPGLRVEARGLLVEAGALPGDPTHARTADLTAPALGTPAGARVDLHHVP